MLISLRCPSLLKLHLPREEEIWIRNASLGSRSQGLDMLLLGRVTHNWCLISFQTLECIQELSTNNIEVDESFRLHVSKSPFAWKLSVPIFQRLLLKFKLIFSKNLTKTLYVPEFPKWLNWVRLAAERDERFVMISKYYFLWVSSIWGRWTIIGWNHTWIVRYFLKRQSEQKV